MVRRLVVPAETGAQRLSWDMRGPAPEPIEFEDGGFRPPWVSDPQGPLVAPGDYTAQLVRVGPYESEVLGEAVGFGLRVLDNYPDGTDYAAAAEFQQRVSDASRKLSAVDALLAEMDDEATYLRAAVDRAPGADASLHMKLDRVMRQIADLRMELRGNPARDRLSEFQRHNIADRIRSASAALEVRLPPTQTQRTDLQIGETGLADVAGRAQSLRDTSFQQVKDALAAGGAPWVPGQKVDPGS